MSEHRFVTFVAQTNHEKLSIVLTTTALVLWRIGLKLICVLFRTRSSAGRNVDGFRLVPGLRKLSSKNRIIYYSSGGHNKYAWTRNVRERETRWALRVAVVAMVHIGHESMNVLIDMTRHKENATHFVPAIVNRSVTRPSSLPPPPVERRGRNSDRSVHRTDVRAGFIKFVPVKYNGTYQGGKRARRVIPRKQTYV